MILRVLISTSSFGTYDASSVDMLKACGLDLQMNSTGRTMKPEEILKQADGCVGILAGTEAYSAETLGRLKNLKVISRCGAGVDTIDLITAEQLGIEICSTPFGPTQAVAELTLGLILNLLRDINLSSLRLKNGDWQKSMGFLVEETTFGIVGLGRIGKSVAALLRTFQAKVLASDLKPDVLWAEQHQVQLETRETLLKMSDVISLHMPYDKSVHHMIGTQQLALMKKGSFLINVSRGGLVDEAALTESLKNQHLRGAAVDTFEQEPYQGPLQHLNNVILTPHIGSYARGARVQMEKDAAGNLVQALRHRRLLH